MRTTKPVEPLDSFERDVPISAAESEILWRLRELNRMGPREYAEFLRQFRLDVTNQRNVSDGEPFVL